MKYYIADAFAEEIFKGNPAGVCVSDEELPAELMQGDGLVKISGKAVLYLKGEIFI